MRRPIEFRCWNGVQMYEFGIGDDVYLTDKPVMQFTGLLDRNQKKIWEGDIVTGTFGGPYEVFWSEGSLGVEIEYDCTFIPFADLTDKEQKQLEVIGNIYEHGYLLEDKCQKE